MQKTFSPITDGTIKKSCEESFKSESVWSWSQYKTKFPILGLGMFKAIEVNSS